MNAALESAAAAAQLVPTPVFMSKAQQLYEMILVRHGLMLVGYSFGAKTSIYRWGALGSEQFGLGQCTAAPVGNPAAVVPLHVCVCVCSRLHSTGELPAADTDMTVQQYQQDGLSTVGW